MKIPVALEPSIESSELIDNNQKSAKAAIKLLVEKENSTFKNLSKTERKILVAAFASKDKIVYGKAFDIIRIEGDAIIDFSNIDSVIKNIRSIIVCEIKSTRKKIRKERFEGYFFGLTTAELLVAQNLKESYRFVFVNINTEDTMELTLKQVFERAKGIYPQWSISF